MQNLKTRITSQVISVGAVALIATLLGQPVYSEPQAQPPLGESAVQAGPAQVAPAPARKIHAALLTELELKTDSSPVKAWVLFTDKEVQSEGDYQIKLARVAQGFNKRATERRLQRRTRPGLFDEHDLPVSKRYLDAVAAIGVESHVVSRWVNGVSVRGTRDQFDRIAELDFVRLVQPVLRGNKSFPKPVTRKTAAQVEGLSTGKAAQGFYGEAEQQLSQINVIAMHDLGFTGAGVVIGILDTGFQRSHEALNNPFHPLNVVAEYDFVNDDGDTSFEPGDPSSQHSHGTLILGTLGAYMPNQLVGAAYNASFILCKTEDITSETPVEEDNYVAGLEFIEANGGDVATSSLSYSDWYNSPDYDGLTAVTTIAVNIATGNGLHCCTAAGNAGHDGDPATARLGAPADALEVLTCGAVDSSGTIASFSSDGPSFDGRVKPEVLARGVDTRTVSPFDDNAYSGASGTSLSTPLVAGAVACIVQAHPDWTVATLRSKLFETADYFTTFGEFDSLFVEGYGTIDALATSSQADCNSNGISDYLDIAGGGSLDTNANGVPDECECTVTSQPIELDETAFVQNRYLAIVPGNPGEQTAIRITLSTAPLGYEEFEGSHRWVGDPQNTSESAGSVGSEPPTFASAPAVCDPVYRDWSGTGTIHVYGDLILPGATFLVQVVNQSCFFGAENNFSAPVPVATARWGDLVKACDIFPCGAPDGDADFDDISAVVDKFRDLPLALIKARADIAPATPDRRVDFTDIPAAVDAFRGLPYSLTAPAPCP